MHAGPNRLDRALEALQRELGPDRVLAGAAGEIARRSLDPGACGALRHLVRPRNTGECRDAVRILAEAGCRPDVIAGLTTFWEPHAGEASVAIDALALAEPQRIDARERLGYFGGGVSVRDADRLARAQGLCLLAYPDSDGSQSLGSMAAVACTTGLGMGRVEPVEQISGLTMVTHDAAVVRTGSAWRRGRGGALYGSPDPTGIFLGSQGRFGIVTEVVLKLWPAPFLAARSWPSTWRSAGDLAAALRHARCCFDQGYVDSLRLEAVAAGHQAANHLEWMLRCWAGDSAETADQRCAALANRLGASAPRCWVESERARRGEIPDYDERFSVPPGEHRARTGRDGFLGVEVTVNWGDQLDAALALFLAAFDAVAGLAPGHRRLGIYASSHVVSIGLQIMLTGGEAKAGDVRGVLAGYVDSLASLGAVPYRSGRLWQQATGRDPAADDAASALVRRAGLGT